MLPLKRSTLTARMICCLLVVAASASVGLSETPPADNAKPAKYVFLFIGDGMGAAQREIGRRYRISRLRKIAQPIDDERLIMDRLPVVGTITTHSANSKVTDSAAAGTALACGVKTNNGMLGMTPEKQPVRSIAEIIGDNGMKVGVLSSVYIDHATPASFYAHQPSRNNYGEISLELPASGFAFFGGGNCRGGKDSEDFTASMRNAGYGTFKVSRASLADLPTDSGKVFACDGSDGLAMPYEIDRTDDQPSLADFTRAAIKHLDGEDGFFMMVEGGKIDWAGHANDIASNAGDVLAMDAAVAEAMDFYARHPDETLIVVTADHETGGLTLMDENAPADALLNQKVSAGRFTGRVKKLRSEKASFEDGLAAAQELMLGKIALTDAERKQLTDAFAASMSGEKSKEYKSLYGNYDALTITCTKIIADRAGAKWTTGGHTGVTVPVTAIGAGANAFRGDLDNTDIPARILKAMGIDTALPVPAQQADEKDQPARKAA